MKVLILISQMIKMTKKLLKRNRYQLNWISPLQIFNQQNELNKMNKLQNQRKDTYIYMKWGGLRIKLWDINRHKLKKCRVKNQNYHLQLLI